MGGAILDSKPDYLSNPPPDYPEPSRLAKQQGVVLLEIIVNENGSAATVTIFTTSGFSRLDESAADAVRDRRFRPAMLGTMKVKSRVQVPVRFRLDDQSSASHGGDRANCTLNRAISAAVHSIKTYFSDALRGEYFVNARGTAFARTSDV